MSRIRANQVFTPGSFPSETYVKRQNRNYESQLVDGLEITGQIISISGPSKSGKTVLVEKVVGRDDLITITGAGVETPADLWNSILDQLGVPDENTSSRSVEGDLILGGEAKGSTGVPIVAKGEVSAKGEARFGGSRGSSTTNRRRGMGEVIDRIANSNYVVLIDDFHYMARSAQEEVAKQIKEAARKGVKIVTASVPHRSDDVVRANPELRGRVMAIDLDYWETRYLRLIAEQGFSILNAELNPASLDDFATEAAGSPQLMQAICLYACFELDLREKQRTHTPLSPSKDARRQIFSRTTSTTDFRSLVDVLDKGPKTRGTERKEFVFDDGTRGDVYRSILKAIATDPPRLTFMYDQLLDRIGSICTGEAPSGSSVTGSCIHISNLAEERFPRERVIEWDPVKTVLDIPDPYLLFYLRWSGRLLEPEEE